MQQKPKTFADDDLFGREAYAKFLEKLILNCGEYHRDDDMKAYTIAIDSPWGTGKSVFLEKFENMLMEDYPEKIQVIHYNAWQNDFWKNAFEPFADTIFRHDLFWKELANETLRDTSKHLMDAAKNVGIAFLKAQLSSVVDIAYLEKAGIGFLDGLKEEMDQSPNSVGKEYRDYTESIQQLQNVMKNFLEERLKDGKLVIIIDELDRCRPTFAIDTLEIIKHIMDVPNVVYIFALDVKQLGAAIKQVYGADTDATGYLMRFFSYYSRVPKANISAMLCRLIDVCNKVEPCLPILCGIAKHFDLTARDIETIKKVYEIMLREFLGRYQSPYAYTLYWLLLCAKYKLPIEFVEKMSGNLSMDDKRDGVFLGDKSYDLELPCATKVIADNRPLSEIDFQIGFSFGNKKAQKTEFGRVVKLEGDKFGFIPLSVVGDRYKLLIDENATFSQILFTPDLKRWDEIKHLTPGEFLLQQMEMYNFIPEIE